MHVVRSDRISRINIYKSQWYVTGVFVSIVSNLAMEYERVLSIVIRSNVNSLIVCAHMNVSVNNVSNKDSYF
jgi:hypothetical protein